jgi:hypothetical protein
MRLVAITLIIVGLSFCFYLYTRTRTESTEEPRENVSSVSEEDSPIEDTLLDLSDEFDTSSFGMSDTLDYRQYAEDVLSRVKIPEIYNNDLIAAIFNHLENSQFPAILYLEPEEAARLINNDLDGIRLYQGFDFQKLIDDSIEI